MIGIKSHVHAVGIASQAHRVSADALCSHLTGSSRHGLCATRRNEALYGCDVLGVHTQLLELGKLALLDLVQSAAPVVGLLSQLLALTEELLAFLALELLAVLDLSSNSLGVLVAAGLQAESEEW